MAHCHSARSRGKLDLRPAVKTFLKALEKILAGMNQAQRARAAGTLRDLLNGLANFKEAIPGLPFKATSLLIADLTMYMSMNKKGPEVWEKVRKLAADVGPNVTALVSFIQADGVRTQ